MPGIAFHLSKRAGRCGDLMKRWRIIRSSSVARRRLHMKFLKLFSKRKGQKRIFLMEFHFNERGMEKKTNNMLCSLIKVCVVSWELRWKGTKLNQLGVGAGLEEGREVQGGAGGFRAQNTKLSVDGRGLIFLKKTMIRGTPDMETVFADAEMPEETLLWGNCRYNTMCTASM